MRADCRTKFIGFTYNDEGMPQRCEFFVNDHPALHTREFTYPASLGESRWATGTVPGESSSIAICVQTERHNVTACSL